MKFLREPLVQFLLLGAALFGVFGLIGKWTGGQSAASNQIVITPGLTANLVESFKRSSQRPPTPQELDALIEDYVREEVLCREARNLKLDLDDPIVRRQLRKRMEFTAEESEMSAQATDDQLREFIQKNPKAFLKDGKLPELSAVRDSAQAEWQAARRRAAVDAEYEKLRLHYVVTKPASAEILAPTTGEVTKTAQIR